MLRMRKEMMNDKEMALYLKNNLSIQLEVTYDLSISGSPALKASLLLDGEVIDYDYEYVNID